MVLAAASLKMAEALLVLSALGGIAGITRSKPTLFKGIRILAASTLFGTYAFTNNLGDGYEPIIKLPPTLQSARDSMPEVKYINTFGFILAPPMIGFSTGTLIRATMLALRKVK